MRWETKKGIWTISRCRWFWLPEFYNQNDFWTLCWGPFVLEWISKDWLDYCERKGCTFGDVFDWLEEEITKDEVTT